MSFNLIIYYPLFIFIITDDTIQPTTHEAHVTLSVAVKLSCYDNVCFNVIVSFYRHFTCMRIYLYMYLILYDRCHSCRVFVVRTIQLYGVICLSRDTFVNIAMLLKRCAYISTVCTRTICTFVHPRWNLCYGFCERKLEYIQKYKLGLLVT